MANTPSPRVEKARIADRLLAVLRKPPVEVCGAIIVCVAVLFNFGLAFLNANLLVISRQDVVLLEIFLVAASLTCCLISANRLMMPWVVVLWILFTILVVTGAIRQSFDAKYYRDALLIPVFITLGMTYAKARIVTLFCVLQGIVLLVMMFEGLSQSTYSDLIHPWSYYVNTREFKDIYWNSNLGLFFSSLRPQGRVFFESLNIHRLSSVFLEPVSLGNWSIVVAIFTATFWRQMTVPTRVYFVVTEVCLIIGSDGRLAFGTCLVIAVFFFLAPRLPKYVHILYLPGAVLLSALLVWEFNLLPYADDLPGRIAASMAVLAKFDLPTVLGIDQYAVIWTPDSGIGYAVVTQSIFGVVVLWIAVCLLQPQTSDGTKIFIHGLCMYVSMALIISGQSVFSIKTAAPLWFIYGYVRARGALDRQRIQAKKGYALQYREVTT